MTALAADTAAPLVPVVEIEVIDSLDVSTLIRLSEQIDEAISLDPGRLVVDLSRCPYIDAQAIRVLLDAHRTMWTRGGGLTLRGGTPETLRLLSIAGVQDVFALDDGDR